LSPLPLAAVVPLSCAELTAVSGARRTYWTVIGGGPDILNGENWQAGYTGTLESHVC
jgi:hypothetical protein